MRLTELYAIATRFRLATDREGPINRHGTMRLSESAASDGAEQHSIAYVLYALQLLLFDQVTPGSRK